MYKFIHSFKQEKKRFITTITPVALPLYPLSAALMSPYIWQLEPVEKAPASLSDRHKIAEIDRWEEWNIRAQLTLSLYIDLWAPTRFDIVY